MPKNYNKKTIPRPLNCFLIYRLEKQQEIVAKCAGANHRDISKIIAKWWQEASEEEKRPFREKARLTKLEHQKLYPNYKYTPQKKTTPKRVYVRKNKKEGFTSRTAENNKVMKMIYEDPAALHHMPAKAVQKPDNDYCCSPEPDYSFPIKSPLSESSYENDIASPFTPPFEWMSSPYDILDTPCIDTMNVYNCYDNFIYSTTSFCEYINPSLLHM